MNTVASASMRDTVLPSPNALAVLVIAAVVDEERIVRVDPESPARVSGRNGNRCASLWQVKAGSAVTPEGLLVEEAAPRQQGIMKPGPPVNRSRAETVASEHPEQRHSHHGSGGRLIFPGSHLEPPL